MKIKNFEKLCKRNFWKKLSGNTVDSYLSTKIGVNSLDGFWENAFYGRTTDARATALSGLKIMLLPILPQSQKLQGQNRIS